MSLSLYDLFPARFPIKKGGSEYAGPCPKSGEGKDRFILKLGNGGRKEKWFCRGDCADCERSGDSIAYLRHFEGMTYQEACEALGETPKMTGSQKTSGRRIHRQSAPAPVEPTFPPEALPCSAWIQRATAFVGEATARLLSSKAGMEYAASRGFDADTIRRFGLGWVPSDNCYEERQGWGISNYTDADGKEHTKLKLPYGLVIPTRRRCGVVSLTVRNPDWIEGADFPKYRQVTSDGSGELALIAGNPSAEVMILLESGLDAFLLARAHPDILALALGGSTKMPSAEVMGLLKNAKLLLSAFDVDKAGKDAFSRFKEYGLEVNVWLASEGKDVGEYFKHGGDLCAWIENGVEKFAPWLLEEETKPPTDNDLETGATEPSLCQVTFNDTERLDALTPQVTDWRAVGRGGRDLQALPTAWAGRGLGLCIQMPEGIWLAPCGRLCDAYEKPGRGCGHCPHRIPNAVNHCRWANVLCGVDEEGNLFG